MIQRNLVLGGIALMGLSVLVPLDSVAGGGALGAHRYVRIAARSVSPPVQRVKSDQPLGWLNDSSMVARVSFEKDVAKKLVCTSKTSFQSNGTRLESAPIRSRGFASLCTLAPGEYEYRVDLSHGAGNGIGLARTLSGTLLVE